MLKNSKRKVLYIVMLICLVQVLISLIWGSRKSYLFIDEVFSYASANSPWGVLTEFPQEEWHNDEWFNNYMTVNADHRFEYSIPYRNQILDVHPPLFYFFLYTVCSVIPGRFSYWAGIGWNIIFFIGCTIVLYFLGKEVFQSKRCGLLTAFLFSISYGGLNTMVFIRMYMLLTLILLLHVFVYVRYMELAHIPYKAYLFLLLTMVAGAMTQYYFLIAAFFCGVWYIIKFVIEKRYMELLKYWGTIALSAIVSLIIFPTMWSHIFYGGRGAEARTNFLSIEGYFSDLKIMLQILDTQMFSKMLFVILGGLLLLFIICCLRDHKIYTYRNVKCAFIGIICMGYFLIVTKVAPYRIDRYLMPIYPLIYMIVIGCTYKLFLKYFSNRMVIILCIIGFGGLTGIHLAYSGLAYTFERSTIERRAVAEKYAGNYAIYIGEVKPIHYYYDIMQVLKEYKGFYYIANIDDEIELMKDMKKLEREHDIVLYLDNAQELGELSEPLQKILPFCSFQNITLLNEDSDWRVYLLHID